MMMTATRTKGLMAVLATGAMLAGTCMAGIFSKDTKGTVQSL